MSDQRFILEMGFGTDQYGQDYTKAAIRAVDDAIRKVAIPMFGSLGISTDQMRVQVTVGVEEPEALDLAAITNHMPRGRAQVRAVKGGLNVKNPDTGDIIVAATAAVEAFLPLQK